MDSTDDKSWVLVERAFFVMGSNLEFKVYCRDEEICNGAIFEAYSEVKKLDDMFSNYKEDSVLSRVNSLAGKGKVSVPEEFIELTERSFFFSEMTDGAFDVTIGKAMELWKRSAERDAEPAPQEIENAKKCVGFRKIKLYQEEERIELTSPCLSLDFGGIAKGYAIDKAVYILKSHGIERGIVNFSGKIYAMEPPPDESGWKVGVNHPRDEGKILTEIVIKNTSVSTSGDYERYFVINGKRFSHIIDSKNVKPVELVPSVTVVSENATDADALSTGLSVMGKERGLKLIEKLSGAGAMMVIEEDGELSISKSHSFKQLESSRSNLQK